jgi:type IV secretory pathway VirB2 component (pilin)
MTSEPESTAPGTGAGPRSSAGQPWPLVVTLALLIILGLAGLRGAVTTPRWNGPLRHDGAVIGLVLEVVLVALLVITLRRRSAALNAAAARGGLPPDDVAAKLRTVLTGVLAAGMVAVAVAIFIGLHLHVFSTARRGEPEPVKLNVSGKPRSVTGFTHPPSIHISLTAVLYALLIAALVAGVLLSVWWSRRFGRPGGGGREDGFVIEDSEDLREAVESGRSALRSLEDARAAIIACYVAMEKSLAEHGTARAVADTPDELLARATRSGVVRGTAAARLTALFYEARFSSHPLGRGQRDAAERALDELAAALADAGPPTRTAEAGPTEARPTEAGAAETGAGP